MEILGYCLILITILILSYINYKNGGRSLLFEDKTEIEKLKRELQELKIKYKIQKYKSKLKDAKTNVIEK